MSVITCPSRGLNQAGQHVTCSLPAGHRGYHWNGMAVWGAPWPVMVRFNSGFCPDSGDDCKLAWKHLGPHAAPGRTWGGRGFLSRLLGTR